MIDAMEEAIYLCHCLIAIAGPSAHGMADSQQAHNDSTAQRRIYSTTPSPHLPCSFTARPRRISLFQNASVKHP